MKKKHTALKVILIILGVVILIPVIAAVILFFILKGASVQTDDVRSVLAQEPLAAEERYEFDTSANQMTINLDKADAYWYIEQLYGKDFGGIISDSAGGAGLKINATGLNFEDGAVRIDIDAEWAIVPVKGQLWCDVSIDDKAIYLKPVKARIGGIEMSVEEFLDKLNIDTGGDVLAWQFDYTPKLFAKIDSVQSKDGLLQLKGEMNTEIIEAAQNTIISDRETERYSFICDNAGYGVQIVCKSFGHPEEGVKLFYGFLEEKPEDYVKILNQVMTFMEVKDMNKVYPGDENCGFFKRLGGYENRDAYAVAQKEMIDQSAERYQKLEDMMIRLFWDYSDGAITFRGGKVLYNEKEFNIKEYLGDAYPEYEGFVKEGECAVGIADYSLAVSAGAPPLVWIADNEETFSGPVDMNGEYPVMMLIKGRDGEYRACFVNEEKLVIGGETTKHVVMSIIPAGEDAEGLVSLTGKVPVWSK